MKIKLRFIATFMVITAFTTKAQKPNLKVYNDSDDIFGCDYIVTPLVSHCNFPEDYVELSTLTYPIRRNEDHTFTELQLFNIYGTWEMCYIGAKVINIPNYLEVKYDNCYDVEENGDCKSQAVEANYDDTFTSISAVMYITDEQ